jgi:hypothetical protein
MLWFILPVVCTCILFCRTERVHHILPVLILSYIGRHVLPPGLVWFTINLLSVY